MQAKPFFKIGNLKSDMTVYRTKALGTGLSVAAPNVTPLKMARRSIGKINLINPVGKSNEFFIIYVNQH